MAEVGFSQIRDAERRSSLNNLPTSFVLSDEAVNELRRAGRLLLRRSEEFQDFLGALRGQAPAG